MQTNDLPRIGVLSADPAAVTQFLRRVQALGADPTALLPLSPAAVPDCEPYLCGDVHAVAPAEAARGGGGAGRLRLHGHRRAGQRGRFL